MYLLFISDFVLKKFRGMVKKLRRKKHTGEKEIKDVKQAHSNNRQRVKRKRAKEFKDVKERRMEHGRTIRTRRASIIWRAVK